MGWIVVTIAKRRGGDKAKVHAIQHAVGGGIKRGLKRVGREQKVYEAEGYRNEEVHDEQGEQVLEVLARDAFEYGSHRVAGNREAYKNSAVYVQAKKGG